MSTESGLRLIVLTMAAVVTAGCITTPPVGDAEAGHAGITCDPGEVVVGFTSAGAPVCQAPEPADLASVLAALRCEPGDVLTGFDDDGAATCHPLQGAGGGSALPADCADGEVLKRAGDTWACAPDVDTDTDTTYTAGSGLLLQDTAFKLDAPAACGDAEKLTWDGHTLLCAPDVDTDTDTDTDTTYDAGSGLALDGTTFRLLAPEPCGDNEKLTWNGDALLCAVDVDTDMDTDTDTTYDAGTGLVLDGTTFGLAAPAACEDGEKLTWNGSALICAADVDTDTDTTYTAGVGLLLDGTTFGLAAPAACTADEKLTWTGTALACAPDADTDTTYAAGAGLLLDGTTISLAAPAACAGEEKLTWTGTALACAPDADMDTTYTPGAGLLLDGTTFGLDTTDAATCTGTAAKLVWDATNGRLACATDQDTTYTAGTGLTLNSGKFGLAGATTSTNGWYSNLWPESYKPTTVHRWEPTYGILHEAPAVFRGGLHVPEFNDKSYEWDDIGNALYCEAACTIKSRHSIVLLGPAEGTVTYTLPGITNFDEGVDRAGSGKLLFVKNLDDAATARLVCPAADSYCTIDYPNTSYDLGPGEGIILHASDAMTWGWVVYGN